MHGLGFGHHFHGLRVQGRGGISTLAGCFLLVSFNASWQMNFFSFLVEGLLLAQDVDRSH